MKKRVLDVGNCSLDHSTISTLLQKQFDADVVQAHSADDALRQLRGASFDLVLINRLLDRDGSEGMAILRQFKQDPMLCAVPVMLITNFPQAQEAAVAEGAERGFGKANLDTAEAIDRLATHLR